MSPVKLLALAPGHRLHREQVMELLWPDRGEKAQANNLRGALYVARQTLDPSSSADSFEAAAGVARRGRDPASYRAAVDLYAGDLLPQDRYEPWAKDRREALRRTSLELLRELAELFEEREELESAVEALRRLVSVEPTHEEARRADAPLRQERKTS